jgi:hypothetical protein
LKSNPLMTRPTKASGTGRNKRPEPTYQSLSPASSPGTDTGNTSLNIPR